MKYSKRKTVSVLGCVMAALLAISCSQSSLNTPTATSDSPAQVKATTGEISPGSAFTLSSSSSANGIDEDQIVNIQSLNQQLAERGLNFRFAYAETISPADSDGESMGQTIFANDRQLRLTAQWVADDERREADGDNLTYLVYQPFSLANGTIDSEPEIDASFGTWQSVKKNSKLDIVKREDTGEFPSIILGNGNPYLADITETGFFPPEVFEILVGPGSGENVLGVAFTFIYVDDEGNPTDTNNDGYADTALKEIMYNDGFIWTDTGDPTEGYDIQTVALHENGHGLGFGHFGKISITDNNGKLQVSPRAVMNAIVLGTQRELLATDESSYNSIYSGWPN